MFQLLKLGYALFLGWWWLHYSFYRFGTCEFVCWPVFALAICTAVVHFLASGAFEEFLLLLSAVFAVLSCLFHI